ncbi:Uncharacterised protein [Mycobacteroides abscessus subsp. abscessus]|nr:Uncharacterised protein [Mycobacteroides abscessus subsp. abscessus]
MFGTTPTPTMTKSAGIDSPSASTTSCTPPLPEKASTRACVRISTPSPRWIRV